MIQKAKEDLHHHHYHLEDLKAACSQSVSAIVHSSVDEFHSEPCPKHKHVDDNHHDDDNDNIYHKVIATVLVRMVYVINIEQWQVTAKPVN